MNLLLFDKQEIDSGGILSLRDRRARHLIEILRVKPGDEIRVGELDGPAGFARVRGVDAERVDLTLTELEVASPRVSGVTVLLALPRPQSLKKVLQYGTSLGVDRFVFINSARVEQSYFSSPLLKPENIREHLLLGLEQARLTRVPQVTMLPGYKPSQRTEMPRELVEIFSRADLKLIADPEADQSFVAACRASSLPAAKEILLAVGPEGGWLEWEREFWTNLGCVEFTLGKSILRVEVALTVLLGQLQALREAGLEAGDDGRGE